MDAIGIIALLLAIPLSILANLLTPTVKNWLALLSKQFTSQRIKVLEAQLKRLGDLSVADNMLFLLQRLFIVLMLLSGGLVFYSLGVIRMFFKLQQTLLFTSYFFFAMAMGMAIFGLMDIDKRRGSRYKEKVEKQISFLKSRLVDKAENPDK